MLLVPRVVLPTTLQGKNPTNLIDTLPKSQVSVHFTSAIDELCRRGICAVAVLTKLPVAGVVPGDIMLPA